MNQEIFKKVCIILAQHSAMEASQMVMESKLVEDLGQDSLDHIETAMDIEEEFRIEIPDEDLESLKTIVQIVNYVEKKVK